jgi:hypothetical protein
LDAADDRKLRIRIAGSIDKIYNSEI